MRILIVEDEHRLAGTLAELLKRQGYTTDISYDGESGLDNALSGIYDLVILDGMLPRLDGFSVLRRLRREKNATPVLMLTARSELSDKVYGLDCGADYYLTKPFESAELLACIRSLLRRGGEVRTSDDLTLGDLRLEAGTFQLICADRSVRLSRKEYDLLEMLLRNRKMIVTKEQLLLKVWGYETSAEDNNVEVYISFLRRKLTYLHSRVRIRTVRMVGYQLEETPEDA
jgi:DNA-binding response OmpR family regulator